MGANIEVINGYKGKEITLAIERGELDGGGTSYSNIVRKTPHWIKNKVVRVIVQYGHKKRLPALSHVPTAQELAQSKSDLALVKFGEAALTLGYPFAAPPGTPKERVAILRKAFETTMKDPKYIKSVKKAKLEYTPQTGQDLQNKIDESARTSKATIKRYLSLTGEAGAVTQ